MRWVLGLLLLVLLGAGAVYFISSRETAPLLTFESPRVVGQTGPLTVTARTPGAKFKAFTITVEQNGQITPIYSLDPAAMPTTGPDTIRVSRPFGKQSVPSLRAG